LRRSNNTAEEIAYRLILEEVPKPPVPGFTGLRTVLRISIPIFARPAAVPVALRLAWNAEYTSSGALRITAVNRGNAHIKIKSVEVTFVGTWGAPISKSAFDYLLPSQSRTWVIDDERISAATHIRLAASTDAGLVYEEFPSAR
jgi:fimbrial chaperone protein